MKTLLVIGGTGFFGKSVLDAFSRGRLAAWGVTRVIAMARQAERLREQAPELLVPGVELLSADIANTDYLPAADYILHAAASTDARNYQNRPEEERRNIQAGTLNFCRLVLRDRHAGKIVYASSGAVYGAQPPDLQGFTENDYPNSIENIAESKRDYALAKRDAEDAIRALCREGGAASIARCFAFVGPWLPRDQHFAIGNFIGDALAGRPILLHARHLVYRSYLHADDLVDWLMSLAVQASPACPVCNVGSDQSILLSDLAVLVARICGQDVVIPRLDNTIVDRYVPSTVRIRALTGVTIRSNLEEAIVATIATIRSRKNIQKS